jgi:type II secretory pathway pseudopilin PulG
MRLIRQANQKRSSESAFTIMEVIVAAAVLIFGFISLYTAMTFGWTTVRMSRENLRATEIMAEKMEQIRLYNWQQVNDTVNYVNPTPFAQFYDPSDTSKRPVYWCKITVASVPTNFPSSYQNDMRLVSMAVLWTNYGNGGSLIPHARTNETYVARNGLQGYIIAH